MANNNALAKTGEELLKIINEANEAADVYRVAKAKKTLEIIAPKDPPPGYKKPTEMATLAMLDADDELTKLRRERDAKAAIMYVAKAEFIAPDCVQ
jgi:hypothetical protein